MAAVWERPPNEGLGSNESTLQRILPSLGLATGPRACPMAPAGSNSSPEALMIVDCAGGHIGVRHEAGAGLRPINETAQWAPVSPAGDSENNFFGLDKSLTVVYTNIKVRLDQSVEWLRCDQSGAEKRAAFQDPSRQQRDPLCEKRPAGCSGTPAFRSIAKRGCSSRMSLDRIGRTFMSAPGLDPVCWRHTRALGRSLRLERMRGPGGLCMKKHNRED